MDGLRDTQGELRWTGGDRPRAAGAMAEARMSGGGICRWVIFGGNNMYSLRSCSLPWPNGNR